MVLLRKMAEDQIKQWSGIVTGMIKGSWVGKDFFQTWSAMKKSEGMYLQNKKTNCYFLTAWIWSPNNQVMETFIYHSVWPIDGNIWLTHFEPVNHITSKGIFCLGIGCTIHKAHLHFLHIFYTSFIFFWKNNFVRV
jgi:hypothetical protein